MTSIHRQSLKVFVRLALVENVGNCDSEAGHAHKGCLFHEQPMLGLPHLTPTNDRKERPQCL